ncbi:MAG: DNRLRE domain-containing protein [Myxococcota bacterium]|nr:DNRLRE domain-containing protein [Myxococcota bacterium]
MRAPLLSAFAVLTTVGLLARAAEAPSAELCIQDGDGGEPTRDVSIASRIPVLRSDANYDLAPNRVDGFPDPCQALVRWELSGLGESFVAVRAAMVLQVTDPSGGGVSAHLVRRAWEPGVAHWYLAGEDGGQWAAPGALDKDLDAEETSIAYFVPSQPGELRVNLGERGAEVANAWLAGTRPNHGLVLRAFDQADALEFENSDAAGAPRLELTQTDGGVVVVGNEALPPTQTDTSLCKAAPDNLNFRGLVVGGPNVGPSLALLHFDTGALPPGAVVLSARLELSGHGATVQARELLRGFDEESASWTQASDLQGWTAAGALSELDQSPVPLGEYTPVAARGALEFNDAGVEVIQGWIAGTRANHGLLLFPRSDDGLSVFQERSSSDPLGVPALCVRYQPKEAVELGTCGCSSTGTGLLGGLGLLGLLRRRRRLAA